MAPEVGKKAPDFTLPSDSWDDKASFESIRWKGPVILSFCPENWSSVYTNQMGQLQGEEIGCFEDKGAKVTGISVGSLWSHSAWGEERDIGFSLLSDSQRQLVEDCGAKHDAGFPERTHFVIDEKGVVRAKKLEEAPSDQPGIEVVLEDLEKVLQRYP